MIANLPAPGARVDQGYMTRLQQQLTQLFRRVAASDEARTSVLMRSPDGRSWDVSVNNAGAVITTINIGNKP